MKGFLLGIAIAGIIGGAIFALPKLRGAALEPLPAPLSDIEAQLGAKGDRLVSSEPEASGIFAGYINRIYQNPDKQATEERVIVKNDRAVAYEAAFIKTKAWMDDTTKSGVRAEDAWRAAVKPLLRLAYSDATGTNILNIPDEAKSTLEDMTTRVCTYDLRNASGAAEEINGLEFVCEIKADNLTVTVMPESTYKKIGIARSHEK